MNKEQAKTVLGMFENGEACFWPRMDGDVVVSWGPFDFCDFGEAMLAAKVALYSRSLFQKVIDNLDYDMRDVTQRLDSLEASDSNLDDILSKVERCAAILQKIGEISGKA